MRKPEPCQFVHLSPYDVSDEHEMWLFFFIDDVSNNVTLPSISRNIPVSLVENTHTHSDRDSCRRKNTHTHSDRDSCRRKNMHTHSDRDPCQRKNTHTHSDRDLCRRKNTHTHSDRDSCRRKNTHTHCDRDSCQRKTCTHIVTETRVR